MTPYSLLRAPAGVHRAEPSVEPLLFAVLRFHEIRFARQEALRSREPDEVIARFDLVFEVIVFRTHVLGSCGTRVRVAVADEGRIRLGDGLNQRVDLRFEGVGDGRGGSGGEGE